MPLTIKFEVEAYGGLDFKRRWEWESEYLSPDEVTVKKMHVEILAMLTAIEGFVLLEQAVEDRDYAV